MWPFTKKPAVVIPEKVYKYDSFEVTCEAEKVNSMLRAFYVNNPTAIPINIAICPSRISGAVQAVLLYKVEVK